MIIFEIKYYSIFFTFAATFSKIFRKVLMDFCFLEKSKIKFSEVHFNFKNL